MKLVTQTDLVASRFSDAEAVRMICEAGFDALDLSMFAMRDDDNHPLNGSGWRAYVKELKDIAESYGKSFTQSHTPFPPFRAGDEEYGKRVMPRVERALEISGELGVEVSVVHPVACGENQFEVNIEYYRSIEHIAADYGFKIALENMWGRDSETKKIIPNICSVTDDFNRYVDALDPAHFTACLDLGHCGLVGSNAPEMIRGMGGERITSLHIHDNDDLRDLHTLPYMSGMDWDEILKALGEINYKGNFTYEADNFMRRIPDELIPAALGFMEKVGRYMMNEIEKNRVKK